MNYNELILTVRAINISCIDQSIKRLQDYCEQYPDVKEFVELILDEHNPIGRQLCTFVWQISGQSISFNDYHSTDTLYQLRSFIGNFFMDDSYFNVRVVPYYPNLTEYGAYASGDSAGTQDPKVLINAARHNIALYNKVDRFDEDLNV